MVLKPLLILIHVHASTHPKNMSEREQPYSMHLRRLTSLKKIDFLLLLLYNILLLFFKIHNVTIIHVYNWGFSSL